MLGKLKGIFYGGMDSLFDFHVFFPFFYLSNGFQKKKKLIWFNFWLIIIINNTIFVVLINHVMARILTVNAN